MEANATDTPDHSGCVPSNDRANDNGAVVDKSRKTRKASESPSKVSRAASLAPTPKRIFGRVPSSSGRAVEYTSTVRDSPARRMVTGTARAVASVLRAAVNVAPPVITRSVPRRELFTETPQGTAPSIADTLHPGMFSGASLNELPPSADPPTDMQRGETTLVFNVKSQLPVSTEHTNTKLFAQ